MSAYPQQEFQITHLIKHGGPLTKRISLTKDGTLRSDGSACLMSDGTAQRVRLSCLDEFGEVITRLAPNEAIALGALRPDLPDDVTVTTKTKLDKLNGSAPPNLIARTAEHIQYTPDLPALALIDFDTKGMPPSVAARLNEVGGPWAALRTIIPALDRVGHVRRHSTSAGISRSDTGEKLQSSGGVHIYLLVRDGGDVERFLRVLHDRCWIAGFGWMMVGGGGQFLDRSIVDRTVSSAERLVFEGAPVLVPPLTQEPRGVEVTDGEALDSSRACPNLGVLEKLQLSKLHEREKHRLAPEQATARAAFIAEKALTIAAERNVSLDYARRLAERICEGTLLSDVRLPFDEPDLDGCTVADVLEDPSRFLGKTLADPLEGVSYGVCKAKVMRRPDGQCWINSFAHGRTVYKMRLDLPAIERILDRTADHHRAEKLEALLVHADLTDRELGRLRHNVRMAVPAPDMRGQTPTTTVLTPQPRDHSDPDELGDDRCDTAEEAQDAIPHLDEASNDQITAPPAIVGTRIIRVIPGELHLTATEGEAAIIRSGLAVYQRGNALVRPVSQEVTASRGRTTIAAGLGEISVPALMDVLCSCATWQRYDGRSKDWVNINPPATVAQVILSRHGQWQLPPIAGIITTPTMRPDGSILSESGYDSSTRIYHVSDATFILDPVVHAPSRKDAEEALALLNGLLAEFPFVSPASKAVALSAMITPVVRGALPVAPLHLFRASTAGSGKTYLADIASTISTGRPCPVISAGESDGETEKRLVGLLLAGYPLISIDNVNGEIGGDLLCQAIERPLVRLRKLGGSEMTEVESIATIYATGNNARVRGDMVRRTLVADLDPGQERPELRSFSGNPVAAVLNDRGRYVSACLTIIRAFIEAECPKSIQPLASFEEWSRLVRGALVWLGCDDPLQTMEKAREDDPELTELKEVMGAWHDALGTESKTTAEVAALIEIRHTTKIGEPTDYQFPQLRETLLMHFGERGMVNTRRMGKWLTGHQNRVVSRLRFKKASTASRTGTLRWQIERV